MLVLEKKLHVSHIQGTHLDTEDSWAVILKDNGMSIIGHDHSCESAILLNEAARENLKFPLLTQILNRTVSLRLTGKVLPKEEEKDEWIASLWAAWRADAETCSKVFLSGLQRHEYIDYDESMDLGEGGPAAYSRLSTHEKAKRLKFKTSAEKNSVLIAYFSSDVPCARTGPPMGEMDDPRYPSYHFAVAVSSGEYEMLTGLLEQRIAFEVDMQML